MEWMDRERKFWLVGGDRRQQALARLLEEDGHTVHMTALEGEGLRPEPLGPGTALAHCVLLPLPVTQGKGMLHTPLSKETLPLETLLAALEPGQILCGGLVSPSVRRAAEKRGLRVFDYYAREECMVANAVPTVAAVGQCRGIGRRCLVSSDGCKADTGDCRPEMDTGTLVLERQHPLDWKHPFQSKGCISLCLLPEDSICNGFLATQGKRVVGYSVKAAPIASMAVRIPPNIASRIVSSGWICHWSSTSSKGTSAERVIILASSWLAASVIAWTRILILSSSVGSWPPWKAEERAFWKIS